MEAASIAHAAGHERTTSTTARRRRTDSSRVEPQLLGMLLFIISEVMVFGAFFTAYFFIRIAQGDPWPAHGTKLPVAVAGVNTAILVSSSFTIHWAETAIKKGQPLRPEGRHPHDLPARLHLPVHPDQRVREHRLRPAGPRPADDLLLAHRPARRARVHRPAAAAVRDDPRLPRALQPRGASRRRGAGHLLALRRHHVARRLHHRLHPLAGDGMLNPLRSEDEAFRFLLYAIAVAVMIVG